MDTVPHERDGFWVRARLHPDRPALVVTDGTVVTFGELEARVNRLSHLLRESGVRAGDQVAVLCGNRPEVLEVALACSQIGAPHTPVNSHLTASEVEHVLTDSGARVLIVDAPRAEAGRAAADAAGVRHRRRFALEPTDGFVHLGAALGGRSASLPPDRSAAYPFLYTSGTSGLPKAVVQDRSGEMDSFHEWAFGITRSWGWGPAEVHLVQAPLYHSGPYSFSLMTLHLGGTVVIMPRWEPSAALEAIDRHAVTTSFMVPTMFVKLLRLPAESRARYALKSLRHNAVIQSGASCPVPVKRAMLDWWGPVLKEIYGGTESTAATISAEDWLEHPGSVGQALPGVQIVVLDEDGRPCPPGTVGTVHWTSPVEFSYHNDPEKTAASRRDGLVTLGDMGHLDEGGWLHIVDRRTDLIVMGGTNVYPAEVEAVLVQHPAVADVAVIGAPDTVFGQQVRAVVEPLVPGGGSPELATEIIEFARAHLAGYKCAVAIDFLDEMPRSPAGKLYRRRLREHYETVGVPR